VVRFGFMQNVKKMNATKMISIKIFFRTLKYFYLSKDLTWPMAHWFAKADYIDLKEYEYPSKKI